MITMTSALHDSIKAAGFVCQIRLDPVWRTSCEEERSELDRSTAQLIANEAADRSTPSQTRYRKFGDEAEDQTGGLIDSCTRLDFSITHFYVLRNTIHCTAYQLRYR